MSFELFDPKQEVVVREGRLPHWYQPGVTYFVTFRTDDSVPQPLMKSWYGRRHAWLQQNGIDATRSDWKEQLRDRPELEKEYHARFTREFMEYLDRGHGACVLRKSSLAVMVANALRHFDQQHHLGDFIVMPNHVHAAGLFAWHNRDSSPVPIVEAILCGQDQSGLGSSGRFWLEASITWCVAVKFEKFQQYIADNPSKARLSESEYLLHSRLGISSPT